VLNTICLLALCGDKKTRSHPTTILLITLSFSGTGYITVHKNGNKMAYFI
jgi:hypothetical protein